MKRWTAKRKKACVRNPDGTFKTWKGGRTKAQLKKKQNNFHGIATHIGHEFSRQNGRAAKVGDCVRKKKKDGTYHKGADWYVKTPHGWRDTGGPVKPSKDKIKSIILRSRKGR